MLNEKTSPQYDRVKSHIQNGSLIPYERIVEEWTENKINTVNMKNVEVTIRITNLDDKDYDVVGVQPQWRILEKKGRNSYEVFSEEEKIPGYEMNERLRSLQTYDVSDDGFAFYFGQSAFPNDPHFYNTSIRGGETKEVHQWFAVPEDLIDQVYLVFNADWQDHNQTVKIVE